MERFTLENGLSVQPDRFSDFDVCFRNLFLILISYRKCGPWTLCAVGYCCMGLVVTFR